MTALTKLSRLEKINYLSLFMRKTLNIIVTLLLTIQLSLMGYTHAQELTDEQVDKLAEDTARDLADELVFENISSLASSACSLYGLGVDLVNVAYDGQWSFVDSLLEITVLFRNDPWRELIWAIKDQKEVFVEDLVGLKKQRCMLGFASPEAAAKDVEQKRQQQVSAIERQIVELEEKVDYYSIQSRNMLFDRPRFGDFQQINSESFVLPSLQVDKIFYMLGGLVDIEVNWEEFLSASKSAIMNVREDLSVLLENIPDDCFAVVTVGHELDLYFSSQFQYQDGAYVNDRGQRYDSFQAFVDANGAAIVEEYIEEYCDASRDRALAEAEKTGAEEQIQTFLDGLNAILDILGQRLSDVEKEVSEFEKKVSSAEADQLDQEILQELYRTRGRLLAMIEYHTLVLNSVGSSGSQSLEKIADSLANFAEAVLGVVSDDEGKKSSRLSFAERFDNANERSLQKICGRIEAMYNEAGRDTSDLPFVGFAKGKRYCRATTNCDDVELSNLTSGSEGLKKLAKCSGFLFDSSGAGTSQLTQDVLEATSEDLGILLGQRALNDLLKQRNLHFESLRNRYNALYSTQTDTTVILEQFLEDTALDLYNPELPEIYKPDSNQAKTHYGLMRRVYQDFWKFLDEQEGTCDAPEKPEQ